MHSLERRFEDCTGRSRGFDMVGRGRHEVSVAYVVRPESDLWEQGTVRLSFQHQERHEHKKLCIRRRRRPSSV